MQFYFSPGRYKLFLHFWEKKNLTDLDHGRYTYGQDCVRALCFSENCILFSLWNTELLIFVEEELQTDIPVYITSTGKWWVFNESFQTTSDEIQKVPLHSTILSTMLSANGYVELFVFKVLYFKENFM